MTSSSRVIVSFALLILLAIPVQTRATLLPGSEQRVEQAWVDAWQKASTEEAQYVNRLALSDSAYLKQHANNPINWYPWADAAFARAKKHNQLILISIGYASCHWCHIMERESFSDIEVASVLNQWMVSIKVDREQQPDIDAYFTRAVETIKGDSGWPITMILLPDRTPVFAANYLSKSQLITAVTRLNQAWQEQPESLKQTGVLMSGEIDRRNQKAVKSNVQPEIPLAEDAEQRLLASVDPDFGGFGQDKKFPSELKLRFLLNRYKNSREAKLKKVLIGQLNAYMNGGLSDIVFGGVFRYTTDRQMTTPHFEKMLYNQALTVSLFSDAASWLDMPVYAQFAGSIVHFVNQYMRLTDGTFAAAIDADHKGLEGGYYLWPGQSTVGLGGDISRISFGNDLFYLYGPPAAEGSAWKSGLVRLRAEAPRKIDNRLTSWNALWISALLDTGETEAATRLADTVWEKRWSENQLFRMKGQPGFLDDYSYLSKAFWHLYLKTMEPNWKSRARLLDSRMLDLFYQNSSISYRKDNAQGQYEIDLYQDSELPSSLGVALSVFSNHQTELKFIDAHETLSADATTAIGNRPEHYLTVIQSGEKNQTAPEHIIANGHGMVSLRSGDEPGQWQLVFDLDENWHINASEVFDERLIPTQVIQTGQIHSIQYPEGENLTTSFSTEPLNVYSNRVLIPITAEEELAQLFFQLKFQACSEQICLLPERVRLAGLATPFIK